jgi:ABC-type polysaccharide/polyol phosphate transport system ATPase subunit
MSSEIAITVENLSKCYKIYGKPRDRLSQGILPYLQRLAGKQPKQYYREFWALKEVSFEVRKGETVGIIGRNGSGKSTLLQMICGILTPTIGSIKSNGRVAALLELGAGFNPEFTGRENVYMNATILGLDKKEICSKFDTIVAFADIGDFIDQPVKTYSSGMYVRLAFAVAVSINPDVLIVDEALAVGDLSFQLKCIEKMEQIRKNAAILFVSHNMSQIRKFCAKTAWIDSGKLMYFGDTHQAVDRYLASHISKVNDVINNSINDSCITEVSTINKSLINTGTFIYSSDIGIRVKYKLSDKIEGAIIGVALFDVNLQYVCGVNTKLDNIELNNFAGEHDIILFYNEAQLLSGTYTVDVGLFEPNAIVPLNYNEKCTSFFVEAPYIAEGTVCLNHQWEIIK